MTIKTGSKVVRINQDNFPTCVVGDVGTVVAENEYTLKTFGNPEKWVKFNMIFVSFNNGKPSPNLVKHLQVINEKGESNHED